MSTSSPAKSTTPARRQKRHWIRLLQMTAGLLLFALLTALNVPVLGIKHAIINTVLSLIIVTAVVFGPEIVGRLIRPSSVGNTQPTEPQD